MIETQEALDNLDAILSVKGLDAVYIGPSDLSISLGYAPGGDKPDEWMMTALKKVLDGCKRHRVQPGIHRGAGLRQEDDRDGLYLRHRRRRQPLHDDGRPGGDPGDALRHCQTRRRKHQPY